MLGGRKAKVGISLLLSLSLLLLASVSLWAGKAENYEIWNLSDYERATGKTLDEFQQSPDLAKLVEEGKLAPVEDRLPNDPLVVRPTGNIGNYGGAVRTWCNRPSGCVNFRPFQEDSKLAEPYPTWKKVSVQIFKNYELDNNLKTLTLHIRKGMKWSDGEPFTAEDVMFWWEDVILNEELTASVPSYWKSGGEPMEVTKVDEYTVQFDFAAPNPTVVGAYKTPRPCAPKHYMKQFMPQYNPDAEKLAKKQGFDTWMSLFEAKGNRFTNPDLPTFNPFILEEVKANGNKIFERNPYYWKVDTAGNQLPYIDKVIGAFVKKTEQIILKVQAGELDYGDTYIELSDVQPLRQGEKKGSYRTLLPKEPNGAVRRYFFNLTIDDPVLSEVFTDVRFRQAMSLAIDREEINEKLFFGLAVPRQYTIASSVPFFEEWMANYYAEYDPERAKELFNEVGVVDKDNDGWRESPSGKDLSIMLEDATGGARELTEMVVSYWEDLGIKVNYKPVSRELIVQHGAANNVEMAVWWGGLAHDFAMRTWPQFVVGPWYMASFTMLSGVPWRQWLLSDGENGEEPPEWAKEIQRIKEEWLQTKRGTDKYMELGKEMCSIAVEHLNGIGTVGEAPQPVVVKDGLRNFPENMPVYDHLNGSHGEQWYWENPEDHQY